MEQDGQVNGTALLVRQSRKIWEKISDHMEPSQPVFTIHITAIQVGQPIEWDRMLFWASHI